MVVLRKHPAVLIVFFFCFVVRDPEHVVRPSGREVEVLESCNERLRRENRTVERS